MNKQFLQLRISGITIPSFQVDLDFINGNILSYVCARCRGERKRMRNKIDMSRERSKNVIFNRHIESKRDVYTGIDKEALALFRSVKAILKSSSVSPFSCSKLVQTLPILERKLCMHIKESKNVSEV